jgi:ATP-dependent exoDNAse (exonuclease V) beta subunit
MSDAGVDPEFGQAILDQLGEARASEGLQQILNRTRYQSIVPDAVREALHRGTLQLQVRNEQPLLANLGASSAELRVGRDDFYTGVVDRLVLALQHGDPVWAHIIDYKTDDIQSAGRASRCEFYRPQLLAYRDLVARAFGIERECVRADLLFGLSGTLVRIA